MVKYSLVREYRSLAWVLLLLYIGLKERVELLELSKHEYNNRIKLKSALLYVKASQVSVPQEVQVHGRGSGTNPALL